MMHDSSIQGSSIQGSSIQGSSNEPLAPPTAYGHQLPLFENLPAFEPQTNADLEGVLIPGRPGKRKHKDLAPALAPLTQLVRAVTHWPADSSERERHVADFRFLVLGFTPGRGPSLYVQIRATPTSHLIVEVGPGTPENRKVKALMLRRAPVLQGRGFQIGGNGGNFRKELPMPRDADDAVRVAHELLALLSSVLLYDGSVDLTFTLCQSSPLQPAHVANDMQCEGLADLLEVWGLPANQLEDHPTIFCSRSHGFDFTLRLLAPLQESPERFWEIHAHTCFAVPRDRLDDLMAAINSKTWLLKAFAMDDEDSESPRIGLAYGINLAGGVTLDHLKCQVFEWIGNVKRIHDSAIAPANRGAESRSNTPPVTVH